MEENAPLNSTPPAHKTIRRITCLGSGFVGGPTSVVTAFMSNVDVTVVDINPERIKAWNSNWLPIYEPGLNGIVYAARDGTSTNAALQYKDPQAVPGRKRKANLHFSTNINKAIEEADLIFVCVNTPTKANGIGKDVAADLAFVETAARNIAYVAKEDKIVVEKSTVPCRIAQSIREILSANANPGVRFDMLSNPEFLAEGTAVRDLLTPDRVIIGSETTPEGIRAATSLVEVYSHWIPRERIITMNLWSSELSKLAANALLTQHISSVNALSAICEATGADVNEVSHACGLGSRIGPHMLKAGPGFGGSCFQKGILNIVYLCESLHLYEVADYWRGIINMNEHRKTHFPKRIISCLFNNLTGKKIAVLGFAFKKDTSDTRESPAIALVTNFVAEKAQVAIYDPKVKASQIWKELVDAGGKAGYLKQDILICKSAYEACQGADAVVIVTEWDEFSNKELVNAQKLETNQPQGNCDHDKTSGRSTPVPVELKGTNQPLSETSPHTLNENSPSLPTWELKSTNTPLKAISHNLPQSPSRINRTKQQPESSPVSPVKMPSSAKRYSRYLFYVDQPTKERPSANNFGPEAAKPERLDWARVAEGMRKPMWVFDGRNILNGAKLEALGFRYEAIGKASKYAGFN